MSKKSSIEIYNGFVLSGPTENFDSVKVLVREMEKIMKETYKEYMGFTGESAAMDARDEVFFMGYEEKIQALGYILED